MKILIIEDSYDKREAISALISAQHPSFSIAYATNMADAIRIANQERLDLIVLDLMIPYMDGVNPASEAGYEFMRQVRAGSTNRLTRVIAISAFPEEVLSYRSQFDKMGVIITSYDDETTWKGALSGTLMELEAISGAMDPLDFLIVCALEEERDGFSSDMIDIKKTASFKGLNLRFVTFGNLNGAILKASQMGLITATHEVSMALHWFDPKILAMSGICAGISGRTHLGQIVCASMTWEYQAGKWSKDGFEIAPLQVQMPASTRSVIDHMIDETRFAEDIDTHLASTRPRPREIHKPILAPMASGSAVIADESRLKHIQLQHRKIAALDMESFGVYYCAHERRGQGRIAHFLSIKTVVDMADSQKSDDLHLYGCRASARAVLSAISRLAD